MEETRDDAIESAPAADEAAPRPPGMPADWGLTPLGIVMELGGLIFLVVGGIAGMMTALMWIEGTEHASLLLALSLASLARADLHRRAGRALIYGHPRGALKPLRHYLAFAGIHTAAAAGVGGWLLAQHLTDTLAVLVGLGFWPVLVLLLVRRTPFWREREPREHIPAAEDYGYESLAVFMVVFAALGAVVLAATALSILVGFGPGGHLVLTVPLFALLAYRSVLHARAAVAGTRDAGYEEIEERGMRYSNAGILTAIATGIVVLIALLVLGGGPLVIVGPLGLFWILYVWPRVVAQLLQTRSTARLIDGPAGAAPRAPDLGLTALGWLLLGLGALGLPSQLFVAAAAISPHGAVVDALWLGAGASGVGVALVSLAVGAIQIGAGACIATMAKNWRRAALAYAVAGILGALWLGWEQLHLLTELGHHALTTRGSDAAVTALLELVPSLILPIATLALVRRRPAASARVVQGGGA